MYQTDESIQNDWCSPVLTHGDQGKFGDLLMTFQNKFSWMKIFAFLFKCHLDQGI